MNAKIKNLRLELAGLPSGSLADRLLAFDALTAHGWKYDLISGRFYRPSNPV